MVASEDAAALYYSGPQSAAPLRLFREDMQVFRSSDAGAIWAPKTQGKTLQEIEVERYGTPLSPELGGTPPGTDLAAPRPVTHTPA